MRSKALNTTTHLPEILARIRARGCVVLLDFDGVLVPIHKDFDKPRLPQTGRNVLKRLSQKYPVAVISGRSSSDVHRRIGVGSINYAGCHGLETYLAKTKKLLLS